jgi:hypothetical protein
MLKPGLLLGEQLESGSMALAIEQALQQQGVLNLDDETPDAAEMRRKTFIAIATGVINHIKAQLEITISANKLGNNVPVASVVLRGADGEVQ